MGSGAGEAIGQAQRLCKGSGRGKGHTGHRKQHALSQRGAGRRGQTLVPHPLDAASCDWLPTRGSEVLRKPVWSWTRGQRPLPCPPPGEAQPKQQRAKELVGLLRGQAGARAEDPGRKGFVGICKPLWPPVPPTQSSGVRRTPRAPCSQRTKTVSPILWLKTQADTQALLCLIKEIQPDVRSPGTPPGHELLHGTLPHDDTVHTVPVPRGVGWNRGRSL